MTPEIKMVAVNSLVPYARNARTHSDAQVAQIAASIAEFGFTNPILTDGARGVIAGHGRLAAARKLALTDVPVIELSHLTAIQKKAYILADNRIAANAGWDEELLKLELVELDEADFNLELMGFDAEEIERLLYGDDDNAGLTDDDAVPEVTEDAVTKPGDVWVMGEHSLIIPFKDSPVSDWVLGLHVRSHDMFELVNASATAHPVDAVGGFGSLREIMSPSVEFDPTAATVAPEGRVTLGYRVLNPEGKLHSEAAESYVEATGGYLPLARIVTRGQGTLSINAQGLTPGQSFKVKAGFKYYPGKAECRITVA